MKLHENKVLPCCNSTQFLTMKTCNVYSTKCLLRECQGCAHKMVEYYLPQPNRIVTYEQWIFQIISYEKNGKMKTVRKPILKEIKVALRSLVLQLENTLPSFFKHVATIAHQFQTIPELKNTLADNDMSLFT